MHHEGQQRKSGEPYIVHPLTMACNALALGIRDDKVVATILLHDVCEDCDVSLKELPISHCAVILSDGRLKSVIMSRRLSGHYAAIWSEARLELRCL